MTVAGGTYHLGVDLGTTYVAAGIQRDGRPEIVTLGDRAPVVPSVLFFKEDGDVLTGEPAARRGLSDPTRVIREFKRRVGDSTPMVVGQTPYSAEVLLAELLRSVYDAVVERQGSEPRSMAITHPANWGSYKIDVLHQAVRMADLGEVETLTEPVAAAIHFAATERLNDGETVAVYDLGGGTFDAAVLRKTGDDFEVLGDVEGIDRLGGIDFDEAVFQHVLRWCESALSELDPDDPTTIQALARLRQECVAAKEALSTDTDVSIPVVLPNLQTEVRLTRAEFESMIRPLIQQTVEALRRALRSAGVDPASLAAILLVGGSSRVPLIAQMAAAELGRPIAVDQHPKHTVALGAAIAAQRSVEPTPQVMPQARTTEPPRTEPPQTEPPRTEPPPTQPMQPVAVKAAQPPPTQPIQPAAVVAPVAAMAVGSDHEATSEMALDSRRAPTAQMASPLVAPDDPLPQTEVSPSRPGTGSPPPFDPGGGDGSGRSFLAIGAVAVFLLLIAAGAGWALTRGDDGGDAGDIDVVAEESTTTTDPANATTEPPVESTTSSTEATSSTTEATTTTEQTTTTAPGLTATINDISIQDGRYAVIYTTNFEPLISSDPSRFHLHFFFDTVDISQAGVPGAGPWVLYDTPSPFTGYAVADRPAGANQMCVTVATHEHAVEDPSLFDCVALPAS